MMRISALRTRDRDPVQHVGYVALPPRPEHEMPVGGHQTIDHEASVESLVGLGQNLLKRGVVRRRVKQREAVDRRFKT